ncbi:squalene--hopene cyclase [Actinomadura rayongensis]|uniref:Squalene--hopene cyclase n=1 Tax=Actinomadura rayongensis TaxID=1429076 RepID=A0A6I4WN58_9ACTN|nr:squalene--hopene cyclase [Actinomadura rayongensis]
MESFTEEERAERIADALDRAVAVLLSRQSDDGHWDGGLDNKVSVDAHHLLAHTFLGLPEPPESREIRTWIRTQQTDEGGWPNFVGGPDELSTSVMAYLALRMGGEQAEAPHMRVAARRIHQLGGPGACRASTRLWLALFGLWPWHDLKMLPPEIMLLPAKGPIALDDFADWARHLVVPLAVITALRPVRRTGLDLGEICDRPPRSRFRARPVALYHASVPARIRRRSLLRARRWLLERQQTDGCWNGTHSATVYATIALHLLDGPGDREAVGRAVTGLGAFVRPRGDGLSRVQFSHGPIWDTANTLLTLRAAGLGNDHPAVDRAHRWLLGQQTTAQGDWSRHRPELAPGGWSFQVANRTGPDTDDTALVLRALDAASSSDEQTLQAADRGHRWLAGMAWSDGGWGAFDTDARVRRVLRLPWHDARAVVDPPTADVTAHVVETLAAAGQEYAAPTRDGVRWLLDNQEPDGSWYGQWGCNYIYGTTGALCALTAAKVPAAHPAVRQAIEWLYSRQNEDGGWGEDQRSYFYDVWHGRGRSTPSQTGWAVHALITTGERGDRVKAGIDWLLRQQDASGAWHEAAYTGTGFPRDAPIRYGSYAQVFATLALAGYRRPAADPGPAQASTPRQPTRDRRLRNGFRIAQPDRKR